MREQFLLDREQRLARQLEELATQLAELERREADLAAAQRELAAREVAVAAAEVAVAEAAAAVLEAAGAPTPAPEPPVAEPEPPVASPIAAVALAAERTGRGPTAVVPILSLPALERLVAAHAHDFPERVEEWRIYLHHLRGFSGVDGRLGAGFGWLVSDVFGDLLRQRSADGLD